MTATDSLQTARTHLKEYRSQYSLVKDETVQIANKWKINPTFPWKRQKLVKKHFDELSCDHRVGNEDDFRVNVFNCVLDIVINQIEKRFQGMHEVCTLFAFLAPSQLVSLQEQDILKSAENLQLKYKEDLSAEFPLQIVLTASMLKDELVKISTIKDLAELLFIKYSTISSSFSEVLTALFLFLTLPVTVATAERSFSKLKIIKNYLRSSTGQERLHNLSLLGIEAKIAKQMDLKDVIRDFANLKSRRMNFEF
ncbi:zinc finger MYM-type protein 1-like [Physella acuta]|uniref:zinc finger MYM-type protein 1-like n=1 Tax=Physella acuta TaxID=109671 RepID=UPI0027DBB409|nr:zinc finger MYM-type protein 1-like [Physella acuta]